MYEMCVPRRTTAGCIRQCPAAPSYVHKQYRCVMHHTLCHPPLYYGTDVTAPRLAAPTLTCANANTCPPSPLRHCQQPARCPSVLPHSPPRLSSLITRRGFVRGSNGGKASLVAGILYRLLQVTIGLVHETCSHDRPGSTSPSLPTARGRPSVPPATAQPCTTCGRTTKVLEQRFSPEPHSHYHLSHCSPSRSHAIYHTRSTLPRSFAHTLWGYLVAHSHRRGDLLDALLQTAHGQR